MNSSSTVTRVATHFAIGSVSEVTTGTISRFAGGMISTGDVSESFRQAIDPKSMLFDAVLGGAVNSVQGISKPQQSFADLMSPEDAARYSAFLEHGSNSGFTPQELKAIDKVDEAILVDSIDYDALMNVQKGKSISAEYKGLADMPNPYDGVKQASEYLKTQGVPRAYRKQIIESFDIETIGLQIADEKTYGLRFYGGNANAEGRYLFETFTPLTNRENLALPYEWNEMTGIQQFQVKNGVTMITGNAAAQSAFGSQYTGGARQWYINNLEDLIKCH